MKSFWSVLILLVGMWCFWSCEKSSSYSVIPEIHFEKLIIAINEEEDILGNRLKEATLTFSFVDGDGDIGVRSSIDPISKIHYTWMKKLPNGQYEVYVLGDTTVTVSTNIPYSDMMNRDEAQNKVLKGTIEMLLSSPQAPFAGVDTMRIEYFIVDRAAHESNVDHTPDFSILDDYVELVK